MVTRALFMAFFMIVLIFSLATDRHGFNPEIVYTAIYERLGRTNTGILMACFLLIGILSALWDIVNCQREVLKQNDRIIELLFESAHDRAYKKPPEKPPDLHGKNFDESKGEFPEPPPVDTTGMKVYR